MTPTMTADASHAAWEQIVARAIEAYRNADYRTAEELLRAAVEQPQDLTPNRAIALRALAVVHQALGHYPAAIRALETAREVLASRGGGETVEHGALLGTLAEVTFIVGRYDEAEHLAERAIGVFEQLNAEREGGLLPSALDVRADVAMVRGLHEQARCYIERASSLREKTVGQRHVSMALSLMRTADYLFVRGQTAKAEATLQTALDIRREQCAPAHPLIAQTLNALGRVRLVQDKPEEAYALHSEALAILQQAFQRAHPDIATTYVRLAASSLALGLLETAEPLVSTAVDTLDDTLGAGHLRVAEALFVLADISAHLRRWETAVGASRRALAITTAVLGSHHSSLDAHLDTYAAILRGAEASSASGVPHVAAGALP